ncbi:MAG TPA: SDR family oxidoreductase [Xanthobacteraceae bacterium]|nr:SDR family oxidoreductase [Xanthobacteraceae bacterium]
MRVGGEVVVVTGGADGIGRALCERFHREGAKAVVVADRNLAGAQDVAEHVGGLALACDVAQENDVIQVVEETERRLGPIRLFCSNAGIADFGGSPDDAASAPNEAWARGFGVHVMAHVYAARALLPRMVARGGGYFLHTISAAGLLTQIGNAVYATTKHAAVGFAEILAVTHRDQGIRVSILCPQGVDTPLLRAGGRGPQHLDGVLTPEQVADATIEGLAEERFLILPHPQVLQYMRNKTDNYERWIGGMAKLRRQLGAGEI